MSERLTIDGVAIEDSFAEAFDMRATRLVVTAASLAWARHAGNAFCGFATSVIGCGCEAGIERELEAHETPDGRPGVALLLFAMNTKELQKQLERRAGQCLLTCPSTAVYAGVDPAAAKDWLGLGERLRYFGDGWQISKRFDGRRYWRIPVMDGEFVCEDRVAAVSGIGGGNFIILARDQAAALYAAERAVAAICKLPGVILPFPGGVVRSGSKVGSKYPALLASTNQAYCPTLIGLVESALPTGAGAVLEIVLDGLGFADIARAMERGIRAACADGARRGVLGISAGNYDGKLGAHHFHLHALLG